MNDVLTPELLHGYIDKLFAKREPQPERFPLQCCDEAKLAAIGFRSFYDGIADMQLTSPSEMRRAEEAGAIWYEDGQGNRLP